MSRLESWLSKEMQFTVASESDKRLTFSGLSKHRKNRQPLLMGGEVWRCLLLLAGAVGDSDL